MHKNRYITSIMLGVTFFIYSVISSSLYAAIESDYYSFTIIGVDDISVPIPVPMNISSKPDRSDLDINGDGLSDKIFLPANSNEEGYVFVADGNGKYKLTQRLGNNGGVRWSKASHQITVGDSNNDGKLDYIYAASLGSGGENVVYTVNGSGLMLEESWESPHDEPSLLTAGTMPGSINVTQSGAALYSVPIQVPPGTNGMQPSLALTYNSQSGRGLVGEKWTLGGISYITRCKKSKNDLRRPLGLDSGVEWPFQNTTYQQSPLAVQLDDSVDAYCLNGRKLLLVDGNNTYRTEIESFRNIVRNGNIWNVYTKDGLHLQFGGTTDSKLPAQNKTGVVQSWAVSRITDTSGNYMRFYYDKSALQNGELIPKEIRYTGNSGISANKIVRFEYFDLPFSTKLYKGGGYRTYSKILSKIVTAISIYGDVEEVVKEYRINYKQNNMTNEAQWRFVVANIQECSGSSVCFNPTRFSSIPTFRERSNIKTLGYDESGDVENISLSLDQFEKWTKYGDVNGDGLNDIIVAERGSNTITVYVQGRNGQFYTSGVTTSHSELSCGHVEGFDHRCDIGDFNGDGRVDIVSFGRSLLFDPPTGSADSPDKMLVGAMKIFTAGKEENEGKFIEYGEINVNQIEFGLASNYSVTMNNPGIYPNETLDQIGIRRWNQFIDFNGDGLTDLVQVTPFTEGGIRFRLAVHINNGSLFFGAGSNLGLHLYAMVRTSDGRLYLCDEGGNTLNTQPSCEYKKNIAAQPPVGFRALNQFADFNGDGLIDIISINPTSGQSRVALQNGGQNLSFSIQSWTNTASPISGFNFSQNGRYYQFANQLVDINGDGIVDVVRLVQDESGNYDGTFAVMFGRGDGTFESASANSSVKLVLETNGFNSMDINDDAALGMSQFNYFVDLNRDGNKDLLQLKVGNYASNDSDYFLRLFRYYGKGDGDFVYEDSNAIINFGAYPKQRNISISKVYKPFDMFNHKHISILSHTHPYDYVNGLSTIKAKTVYSREYRVGAITDGNGKIIDIDYQHYPRFNQTENCSGVQGGRNLVSYAPSSFVTSHIYTYYQKNSREKVYINQHDYSYHDAKINKARSEFAGFGCMVQVDSLRNITEIKRYNQEYPVAGTLNMIETQRSNDSTVLARTTNLWRSEFYAENTPRNVNRFNYLQRKTEQIYELDGSLSSQIITTYGRDKFNHSYDAKGNPTYITTSSGDGHYTIQEFDYYYNAGKVNEGYAWMLSGKTSNTTVYTDYQGSQQQSNTTEVQLDYYADTGLLERRIVEPNRPDSTLWQQQLYEYQLGMISRTTTQGKKHQFDGEGAIAGAVEPMADRVVSTEYSDINKIYLKQTTTNGLSHQIHETIDQRFGTVVEKIDLNQLKTINRYDSLGRLKERKRPDGSTETLDYASHEPGTFRKGVGYRTSVKRERSNGSQAIRPVTTYYDPFGRQTHKVSIDFDGLPITEEIHYHSNGKIDRQSLPYKGDTATYFINNEYDVKGRLTQIQHPNGGVSTKEYKARVGIFGSEIITTKDQNGKNQINTEIRNAVGQIESVTDAANKTIRYTYEPGGNLKEIHEEGVINNNIEFTYDVLGRKIRQSDPDMGVWTYKYNSFGELQWQQDAEFNRTKMTYDVLGRKETRTLYTQNEQTQVFVSQGTDTWTYDLAPHKGLGKLFQIAGANDYQEVYNYNTPLGDISRINYHINDGVSGYDYQVDYHYDGLGRIKQIDYPDQFTEQSSPERFSVEYEYSNGFLAKIRRTTDRSLIWEATGYNEFDQITNEQYGPTAQIKTDRSFYAETGLVDTIKTNNGTTTVQNEKYEYDHLGNINYRRNLKTNLQESFGYDSLNRITQANVHAVGANSNISDVYTYKTNGNGNFDTVVGVGTYTYGSGWSVDRAGPHAVKSISGSFNANFEYDRNGSMVLRNGRQITYTPFNKPATIETDTGTISYRYDPRNKRVVKSSTSATTMYVGDLFEYIAGVSKNEQIHYVPAGSRLVAIETHTASDEVSRSYLHGDHLGSATHVTQETGSLEERSYGAFGASRSPVDWVSAVQPSHQTTTKGYTGHEMEDDSGLINMGGRLYDPVIKRFISADPISADVYDSQSLNRYAYVYNNPLKYTDPTGYYAIGGIDPAQEFELYDQPFGGQSSQEISLPELSWEVGSSNSDFGLQGLGDGSLSSGITQGNLQVAGVEDMPGWLSTIFQGSKALGTAITGGPENCGQCHPEGALANGMLIGPGGVQPLPTVPMPTYQLGESERDKSRVDSLVTENVRDDGFDIKYHYTYDPESSFRAGLWPYSSVTDKIYFDAYEASQELGIPIPDKMIPIIDRNYFIPADPPIVDPSFRYRGGGTDFYNPSRVPPEDILPAIPIGP